jgi:TniQ
MKGTSMPSELPPEPMRLNLAPPLHADESFSSWLERFAGAYEMTREEFLCWLGFGKSRVDGVAFQDLDVSLPRDLSIALNRHTGIGVSRIERQRLEGDTILPRGLRGAFCPQCVQEKGARLVREWADAWSLMCWQHRCFLRTQDRFACARPNSAPQSSPDDHADPPGSGGESSSAAAEPFAQICRALGVDEGTEFLHVYYWLANLHRLAILFGASTLRTAGQSPAAIAYAARYLRGAETLEAHWRVQRDLVIFCLIKFRSPSLLQTLDPSIREGRLIQAAQDPETCGLVIPRADYFVRLFAAVLALHLWERMLDGTWRARHADKIVSVLHNPERWSDEDWWLERRLHAWAPRLQRLGRELFGKQSGWTQLPPWFPCRHSCAKRLDRGSPELLATRLPPGWHCRWEEGAERSYAPEVYVTGRLSARSDPYYWAVPSKQPLPR